MGGLEGSQPPPSCISSEGGAGGRAGRMTAPSVSRFERGRGWWAGWKEVGPLRLALRVREGMVGGLEGSRPPLSRASSKGGAGGCVGRTTAPLSRVLSEGGAGGCDGPGRVVVVESEVELQQVVKFNMHVTCHVILGAGT